MNVLPMLLGISLVLGLIGLVGFIWGIKRGMFEDPERVRHKILLDDEEEEQYQQMLQQKSESPSAVDKSDTHN
jgi:thioredoxin reductase (NADPH)